MADGLARGASLKDVPARCGAPCGTHLFSAATRVLVNAMEASAVRRLICVTGFEVGDSRGRGGLLYTPLFACSSGVSMSTRTCRSASSAGAGSSGRLFAQPFSDHRTPHGCLSRARRSATMWRTFLSSRSTMRAYLHKTTTLTKSVAQPVKHAETPTGIKNFLDVIPLVDFLSFFYKQCRP